MANEFIARKGLIVLANGAKVTGSLLVSGSVDATGYHVSASIISASTYYGDGSNLTGVVATVLDIDNFGSDLTGITVAGSDKMILSDAGTEGRITVSQLATPLAASGLATTGSNTFVANQTISGSILLGSNGQIRIPSNTSNTLFGFYDGSNILGAYYQMWGGNAAGSSDQIGSAEFVYDNRNNADANFHVASFNGTTWTKKFNVNDVGIQVTGSTQVTGAVIAQSFSGSLSGSGANIFNIPNSGLQNSAVTVTAGSGLSGGGSVSLGGTTTVTLDTSSAHFISGSRNVITFTDTTGASGIDFTYTAGTASAVLQNSAVTVTAGSGLSGGGSVSLGGTTTVTLDTSSAHFTGGVKEKLNADGVVSSSVQIDVRNTTGIATIATTGSNTFTGIQTITNTTNSTNYADGALVVQGGVGIAKDVNISGSLTVTGLLSAVSMSTQYVTSSQYTVGVSRVIVNDDDSVRFAGLSVVDSGSSYGTGSLLWDSFNNRWIYQADDQAYNSAVLIAGPQNTGSLGDEVGLVTGRIPVAVGDDHIDSRASVSPLRIEGTTLHAEANVYVTGSVTASAFAGDGSQLTGIVTNLNITGSDGGTGTVSLKTQALTVDGTNGIAATVSGQTITISGSDATTSAKGVAAFNSANFSVVGGQVTASAITFNGVPLNLGSSYAFGLQNITSQGASTGDQVSLNGGAIIHGVLYSSGSNTDVDSGTEVVATVQTGSYDAAFFDYVVKKGSNYRAGTVMAVWEAGTSNVEYTDTSTNDLGNTNDIVFTVDILTATARLKATAASDNWIIKSAVRAL